MNQSRRTVLEGREVLNHIKCINTEQYGIYCITSAKSLTYWGRGPFRICVRFSDDKTIYGIVQRDLFPEFDAVDYLKWANFDNMGIGFFEIEWEYFLEGLKDRAFSSMDVVFVSGRITDSSWDFFKYYWEHYFPYFPITTDWE
ncbi:E4.1 [Odocoileus adenovirus 1]|uniref:E4.1 n=2 Tax=Deer atadenovirus A TaxID=2169706 RepID=A0A515MFS7_9ADEN|nr:E4.1 [Odocoileus adenovirus 1]QDM55334.1 E4.1 [Deer atadenovirus A]ASU50488.1 E4.1 [Odocoileus adenovirus 1]ASU50515.1 E4.1 [Odocoileus adenovirus 1]ASU50542.1 E4.1 [Odocoileus adenovirus 1]ASU50569.1 E4.1 [Odocoileus adenovirus 1]